jgi:hypothetical protein
MSGRSIGPTALTLFRVGAGGADRSDPPGVPARRADGAPAEARRAVGRRIAILAALSLALAACGRKGDPVAPADADPLFPRRYPTR